MSRKNLSTTFCVTDDSRFQFVYASRIGKVLFSVYAVMHLDKDKQLIKSIEFIMVNHSTNINEKIGFKAGAIVPHDEIEDTLPNRGTIDFPADNNEIEPDLNRSLYNHFILPLEKNSVYNYTVYKPIQEIPVMNIINKNFNIKRVVHNFLADDEGMDCDVSQKLVGITCIESNLFMLI